METHALSMHIRESFLSPNGTPLKLKGIQPDQVRYVVVRVWPRKPDGHAATSFLSENSLTYTFILGAAGGSQEPPKISLKAAGIYRPFWKNYVFKRLSKKSGNYAIFIIQMLHVTISKETRRNRFGTDALENPA